MTRQQQKAADFQALHAGEPFVIPNPWDAGSDRVLAAILPTYRVVTPEVLRNDKFSGACRDRTGDLRLAKAALSQLS